MDVILASSRAELKMKIGLDDLDQQSGQSSLAETLNERGFVVATPAGMSMWPMLHHRRDSVVIRPAAGKLQRHDVALFRRLSGQLVLHRIIAVPGETYTFCGDNQWIPEQGIRQSQILGRLEGFYRGGVYVACSAPVYRLYVHIWCTLLPLSVRRVLLRGMRLAGRIWRWVVCRNSKAILGSREVSS